MRIPLVCAMILCAVRASVLDLFEPNGGHEPRVAVNCHHLPFHVDLDTGAWIAGDLTTEKQLCDKTPKGKEQVKRYCQLKYPALNVTNIVEANEGVHFSNWCTPGSSDCNTKQKVVPYRCLVHEYEADALMVPNGCTFDHEHDENKCVKHDNWKRVAKHACAEKKMKLDNYGILLSCGTDVFTGVEFVCCPPTKRAQVAKNKRLQKKLRKVKQMQNRGWNKKKHQASKKKMKGIQKQVLASAIAEFQVFLPLETKGCDRSQFGVRETAMEERHRDRIAAVVDEWDEAEKRYNKLKRKDPVAAEEKMKRTLEVFRETLAALEEEAKEEKARLRVERATCINTQLAKSKRDAMLEYIVSVEEQPPSAERILKTVKKFIQVCEHDRVHSLRHFEHVRNRDRALANSMRTELLQHLKDLNTMVNESMSLLTHLPRIAEQFGLDDMSVMLKPRLMMPEVAPVEEHSHSEIPEELRPLPEIDEDEDEDKEILSPEVDVYPNGGDSDGDVDGTREPTDSPVEVPKEKTGAKTAPVEERPPVTKVPEEKIIEKKVIEEVVVLARTEEKPMEDPSQHHHRHSKRSAGFAAVIGLSCGALVIMLGILVALVVRRKRGSREHVVIPTEDNDDQEHLVQMQKKGFENPTYKFYYY